MIPRMPTDGSTSAAERSICYVFRENLDHLAEGERRQQGSHILQMLPSEVNNLLFFLAACRRDCVSPDRSICQNSEYEQTIQPP